MPIRKFKRRPTVRKFKKRRFARNRVANNTIVNRSSISVISPRYITKLKYSETKVTSSTAGLVENYLFNLNSLYDPDRTGVGHQPHGFTHLAELYNRYRVFAVSWRVSFTGDNTKILHSFVMPQNDASVHSVSNDLQEQPRCIHKMVSGTTPVANFRGKIFLPNLTGVTSATYKADDIYAAHYNQNPGEAMTLLLGHCDIGSATVTGNWNVTITYHTEFYDPKVI